MKAYCVVNRCINTDHWHQNSSRQHGTVLWIYCKKMAYYGCKFCNKKAYIFIRCSGSSLVLLLLYNKNRISKYVNFCIWSKPSVTFPQMALFLNFGALCAIRLWLKCSQVFWHTYEHPQSKQIQWLIWLHLCMYKYLCTM